MIWKRVHRPDGNLAIKPVKQAHSREARLGYLRGTDRVICARSLAAALRVEPRVTLAEANELSLHSVGDAKIEVLAVRNLEEACRLKILVVAAGIDISPELARGFGNLRFAGQIFSPFHDWRSEAEIEAEQRRFLRAALDQPMEHFLA